MNARSLVRRIFAPLVRAAEGAFRPGPYYLPVTGGWLADGAPTNWWQTGMDPLYSSAPSAIVEACVSAYSQTVAMLPGDHWRSNNKGGRERVSNSSLSRVLRKPNDYQSISDFMLNITRALYLTGNAYALALRNDRYEIDELHLMNPDLSLPQIAVDGSVFYRLSGNAIIDRRIDMQPLLVPARDVLHIRLHASKRYPHPLVGETPLLAALMDIAATSAITNQQIQFYANQARPSAVLSTDLVLDKEQVQVLRDRWDEQSKGLKAGGVPILTAGLKVQPWGVTGKDTEIADMAKLSAQNIALAFRIPLQILGIGGTTYSSTELLMQSWKASGLGFCLNHIEESFGNLFSLRGGREEYVEFDTDALLRSAHKERVDALARGVLGGIYSPNEARAQEGLDAVEYGDAPRLQAQVVPLSAAGAIPTAPSANAAPASAAVETAPPAPKETAPPPKDYNHVARRELQRIRTNVSRASRRFN